MKKYLLALYLFGTLIIGYSQNNKCPCDYVSSGYYQLVYEADVAYLSGDKETAYQKMTAAEKACPLIEQSIYREISNIYMDLLVEYKHFDDAVYYLSILVRDYGFPVALLEKKDYFPSLSSHIDWEPLRAELYQLNAAFYSRVDTNLVKEIKAMQLQDQAVRKDWQSKYNDEEFIRKMNETDNVHAACIKEIFDTYGFPGERLIGRVNTFPPDGVNISAMLMHFDDINYFEPILLRFIRSGECEPEVLGSFIDSRSRMKPNKDKFIYRIYENVGDDEIWDIDNLDNRRKAIGMPTMEMNHLRDSLIRIKYDGISNLLDSLMRSKVGE
jgi:hypothetical protein